MYTIVDNGEKKYITSKKELFSILSERNIAPEKFLDIANYPYFYYGLGIDEVAGKTEVTKTLKLIRDFIIRNGMNTIAEYIDNVIKFINESSATDLELCDNLGYITLSGVVNMYTLNNVKDKFSSIMKNTMFKLDESVSSICFMIPIILVKLIPSDEFNSFVKEVSEDED